MPKTTTQTQTTRMNGKRVRIITTTSASGTKVKVEDAPVLEWQLQAAAVRSLKAMPEYAGKAGAGSFTLAADMNGDYRSKRAAVIAKATGIAAGDPDLRIYGAGGRMLFIEYKNAVGRLSVDQKDRHAILRGLGYRIEVIKAASEEEAAMASVALVRGWLAANDNEEKVTAMLNRA